jgi:S1-C subfamily serine protease
MSRSHLVSAVIGGVIVAGGLLAFGVGDRRATQTIYEQSPVAITRADGSSDALTPQSIFNREAPSVVHVSARLVEPVDSPFDVLHESQTGTMTGSGFLVDRQGDVMTDFHLIDGASHSGGIFVRFNGGVERSATLVADDPSADIAIVRVNMQGLPRLRPLPLGQSTSVRIGDPAMTIGDPYGVDRSLSSGIVSSLAHQLVAANGTYVDNVIQTDQAPDAASAGGPLLDGAGRVIGITSQMTGADGNTVSFATPIDTADQILRSVQRGGLVSAAYIGLSAVTPRHMRAVSVTTVVRGGPAARAGIHSGDVIVRLGGDLVRSVPNLAQLVDARNPGQQVAIEIMRAGKIHSFTIRLGARP